MPVAGGRPEALERALTPFEELVALAVPLELALGVVEQGEGGSELINLHGVIDDQIDGHDGIDAIGLAAQASHGGAHGGQIDDRRHAGEVLQDDPSRFEGYLERLGHLRRPAGQSLDVFGRYCVAVCGSQHGLQKYSDRKRQLVDVGEA